MGSLVSYPRPEGVFFGGPSYLSREDAKQLMEGEINNPEIQCLETRANIFLARGRFSTRIVADELKFVDGTFGDLSARVWDIPRTGDLRARLYELEPGQDYTKTADTTHPIETVRIIDGSGTLLHEGEKWYNKQGMLGKPYQWDIPQGKTYTLRPRTLTHVLIVDRQDLKSR